MAKVTGFQRSPVEEASPELSRVSVHVELNGKENADNIAEGLLSQSLGIPFEGEGEGRENSKAEVISHCRKHFCPFCNHCLKDIDLHILLNIYCSFNYLHHCFIVFYFFLHIQSYISHGRRLYPLLQNKSGLWYKQAESEPVGGGVHIYASIAIRHKK